MINLFLRMKKSENFFPLYLILKLNQKIPTEYVDLFFEDSQPFTVRKAVIFILSIIDNEFDAFNRLMGSFLKWNQSDRVRTRKDYQCILKGAHFSLQNISKANAVSQILRFIHRQNLNKQSCL